MLLARALRVMGVFACVLITAAAHAQSDSATHPAYVVAGATVDEDGSKNSSFDLGLPLGRSAWLHAGAGREESNGLVEDLNEDVLSAGLGVGGRHVELTGDYVRRKDGSFEQADWSFALDWRGARAGVGADLFLRRADAETIASIERRRRTPLSVRIVESLDATGYGLHGDVDVSEHLNVFASAMAYDYEDVDTNHPLLSRLLFLNGSGVTRDEAFLDHSVGVGATYRFPTVSFTTQYLRDEALVNRDVTDTLEVSALMLLGEHWSLTPSLGYSDSDAGGGLVYGGLSVGYGW